MITKKKIYWKTIRTGILSIVIGILLFFIVYFIWHPFIVSGNSMSPTFKNGDILLCSPNFNADTLMWGDVVIIQHKYQKLVKRIVAVPGDVICIQDGIVYVNDRMVTDYTYEIIEDAGILSDTSLALKDNEYFCLGDNVNYSSDSRTFGPVPYENIKFVVKRKFLQED